MNLFVRKYRSIIIGFLFTIITGWLLYFLDIIIINKNDSKWETLLLFVVWWIAISFVFHNLSYIKKHKNIVFKVLGLTALLIGAMLIDDYMNLPNNPITLTLIVLFVIGVVFIIYQQWKWFKNLQSEKTKAELALLKSQINPHFFFNTLNNLYTLTLNNSKEAPEVILKLSDVMRHTIYQGKKDKVSLKDEIDYLKNYIALHDIRYKKNVTVDFTHNVKQDTVIAPLLLIVLLENAFKHGVETLRNNAYINMNLSSKKGVIVFIIENNFEDIANQATEGGLGLENLTRRLELIYPNKHKLHFDKTDKVFKVHLKIDTA